MGTRLNGGTRPRHRGARARATGVDALMSSLTRLAELAERG